MPRYGCILLLFLLGLMAKPMLVTLPFLLLLLDFWPLNRFWIPTQSGANSAPAGPPAKPIQERSRSTRRRPGVSPRIAEPPPHDFPSWPRIRHLLWEKIPLFILSVVFSVLTLLNQQREGFVSSLQLLPLDVRTANSLLSYVRYIGKMFWPDNLAVFYPYAKILPLWQVIGAALILIVMTAAVARIAKRFPYLIVGWLWYLGLLVPVIGLVSVGLQALADRYTYVPLVGLFIMIAWGVPELVKKWQARHDVLAVAAAIVLSILTAVTWTQLSHWRDSAALFRHTIAVTSDNSVAQDLMGSALRSGGDVEGALVHFAEAIRINPYNAEAHNHLGNILANRGALGEAVAHYAEAVRVCPDDEIFRNNLGNALYAQGKVDEAIGHLRDALRIKPGFTEARYNLGSILGSQGKHAEAVAHFREALRVKPGWAGLHNNLGSALLLQGNIDEAVAHFREALRIQPDYPTAQNNLRDALMMREKR